MLYKSIVLAASFGVAVGAPSHRATSLQTPDPEATRALCEACVDAEDKLIGDLTTWEGAVEVEAGKAKATAAATGAWDEAVTALGKSDNEVADLKEAVAAIVGEDEGALTADTPPVIIDNTEPLRLAAQAWLDAKGKNAAQVEEVARLKGLKEAAEKEEAAAEDEVARTAGDVTGSRSAADKACTAMRGSGYRAPQIAIPVPAPLVQPLLTIAPLTIQPMTAVPVATIATAAPVNIGTVAPTIATAAPVTIGTVAPTIATVAPSSHKKARMLSAAEPKASTAALQAMYAKIKKERALKAAVDGYKAKAKLAKRRRH